MRDYSNTNQGNVSVREKIAKKNKKVTYACYCYVCDSMSYVYQTDLTAGTNMCSKCAANLKRNLAAYSTTNKGFVYGIYHQDVPLYIGITNNPNKRFEQHKNAIKNGCKNTQEYTLYQHLREYPIEELEMKILEKHSHITRKELEKREKYWISTSSPLYNFDGVKRPYHSSVKDVPVQAIRIFEGSPTRFVDKAYKPSKQRKIIEGYIRGLEDMKEDYYDENMKNNSILPPKEERTYIHIGHHYKK